MDLAETHPARWDTPENLLWMDEPRMHEGVISPLDRPGFGVRLNEEMV
jgi:L-alanine-DL-glutamate epimerase-like enolase superfamily enzyme